MIIRNTRDEQRVPVIEKKLNDMFSEMGGMKNSRKFFKEQEKKRR